MNQADKRIVRKIVISLSAVLILSLTAAALFNLNRIQRLYSAVTLFDKAIITENFRSMGDSFSTNTIHKGEKTFNFKRKEAQLPEKYIWNGKEKKVKNFLEDTDTTGLIIIKDDTILYEKYYKGNTESSKCISWSVCKSFISALFGIAVADGKIKDINQNVTDYVPVLAASGYGNVRIKDVLQMSSGIGFNEDYGAFNSDINKLGRSFALNNPLENFIMSLKQEKKPGTFNHYVSMDTQVLGMIITSATGKTLTSYIEEKLWKPIGMESDAFWLKDSTGMEVAFGGLNVILRDYARFGRLYLNNGNWNGKQIIPVAWIKASVTPDAPHLMPGKRASASHIMGYGYQWWIPENSDGDFMAIGVYGQAIYINPKYKIVIAKTSANDDYTTHVETMERESVEMYRAIAKDLGR